MCKLPTTVVNASYNDLSHVSTSFKFTSSFVKTSSVFAFKPKAVVKVVAKWGSCPNAVAHSLNVSSVSSSELTKFVISAFDSAFVYDAVEPFWVD